MTAEADPLRHGPHGGGARPGPPAVECTDLVVRYGSLVAVDELTLEAWPGEVVALLGPNGAGKTSTIECLEGYRRPAGGRVRVLGLDPVADHRAVVGRLGVMLQRGGIYPMLNPRQVLELFANYYEDPEDPGGLLDLLSLERAAGTPWRHLSGGEQQRLSLALALVGRPVVVFLDEPTAGVDPEGRQDIRTVVGGLAARGACVLLTTHELAEAELMADRVLIVHRGRLVAGGTVAELAAGLPGDPVVRFGAAAGLDTASLGRALAHPVVEEEPGRYRVDGPADPLLTAALAGWLAGHDAPLLDLRTTRSLEETYLELVGESRAQGGGTDRPPTGAGRGARRGARGRR